MDLLRHFEQQQVKDIDRPKLRAGDVVRVEIKIKEGDKSRLQTFEGMILGVRGSGPSTTFTVRRETGNFGVERIFPLYSPLITSIDIVKRQKVRRAQLSYMRQTGRRRFKEDVAAMQRLVKEEADKKKLVEDARKKAEEEAKTSEDSENSKDGEFSKDSKDGMNSKDGEDSKDGDGKEEGKDEIQKSKGEKHDVTTDETE